MLSQAWKRKKLARRKKPRAPSLPDWGADALKTAQWVVDRALVGKAPRTRSAYFTDLHLFTAWTGQPSLAHAVARLFAPSGEALAQQWLDSMAEQRFATRRRRAATLRTIAYWGARYGIGPVEGFSKLLVTTTERAVPTEETFQKMLNATSGPRDRAILHLVALGLSRSEIVGLRIGDYDREKKTLSSRVRRREKLVQVSGRASSTLEEWLDVDVSGESETTAPIFHGGHRRVPLVVSSVANIFKRISAKAGVSVKPGELRRVAQCR